MYSYWLLLYTHQRIFVIDHAIYFHLIEYVVIHGHVEYLWIEFASLTLHSVVNAIINLINN